MARDDRRGSAARLPAALASCGARLARHVRDVAAGEVFVHAVWAPTRGVDRRRCAHAWFFDHTSRRSAAPRQSPGFAVRPGTRRLSPYAFTSSA
jgi:hypothetical protein